MKMTSSVFMLLVSIACLVLSSKAAMLMGGASSSASSLLLRQVPGKVDTKVLVASLDEVAHGLQVEEEGAMDLDRKMESHCKEADKEFSLALDRGKRTFDMATADYEKAGAAVKSLETSLAELKAQITNSNQKLDELQANLKKARLDSGELKKSASSALQQMDVAIAKTSLHEGQKSWKASLSLERKTSDLERLSEGLSFVQMHAKNEPGESKPVLVLKADKEAVVKASAATQKGLNEEEKKILELVKVEREKLHDLEDILSDMQPAFTNKLMQAMEINRTLAATSRGMQRDADLMDAEMKKCDLVHHHLSIHKAQRSRVTSDVRMASKVLESMDTALFLSRDLIGLKGHMSTSLLQLGKRRWRAPADESLPTLLQGEAAADSFDSSQGEQPFGKVTQIISGLIASLKAQANEDVNQNQFCQDGLSQNRRDYLVKKNGIDTLSSTIRWSKMAITRIDDDTRYLEDELHRLQAVQRDESRELETETKRLNKEIGVHKTADEVLTKAVLVLAQLCGSSLVQQGQSSLLSLIQQNAGSSKGGSRFSQCKEASKLLQSASAGMKELDRIGKGYLDEYTRVSESIASDATTAQHARDSELKSAKAARAQRALELATANKDVAVAHDELSLIDKTKQELEHQCSHVETHEDRMARQAEEVHALKEALNVLDGESIPA